MPVPAMRSRQRRPSRRGEGAKWPRSRRPAAGTLPAGRRPFELVLAIFREIGDRVGETWAVGNLGCAEFHQGLWQQATGHIEEALALSRDTGDQIETARWLDNLGFFRKRLGRFLEAADHLRQAQALYREVGSQYGEAQILAQAGTVPATSAGPPARPSTAALATGPGGGTPCSTAPPDHGSIRACPVRPGRRAGGPGPRDRIHVRSAPPPAPAGGPRRAGRRPARSRSAPRESPRAPLP